MKAKLGYGAFLAAALVFGVMLGELIVFVDRVLPREIPASSDAPIVGIPTRPTTAPAITHTPEPRPQ